jgi:Holliday junction resolvase RusA-like endonuclease
MEHENATRPWLFVTRFYVLGAPHSKANSRRMATNRSTGQVRSIKSKSAMKFAQDCHQQIPTLAKMLDHLGHEVACRFVLHYPSLRSDLDPSIVLDAMQGRIYANDRCVTTIVSTRGYDKEQPRVEVEVFSRPWHIDGKPAVTKVTRDLRRMEKVASMTANGVLPLPKSIRRKPPVP